MQPLVTNLSKILQLAEQRQIENDHFCAYIQLQDGCKIDTIVHELNEIISSKIDCRQCGNCCKSLMINVDENEVELLAVKLHESVSAVKDKYIETSLHGQMIINTIPCHFLEEKSCTIYNNRFNECREFPHLHKSNFNTRLPATINYYAMCPIIFNVVEELKSVLCFFEEPNLKGLH